MGQDTTRYRGFPRRSRFWLVSRFGLSFWSCLDATMKWKRTLMSPLASIFCCFFSSTAKVFWASKVHTYTTRPVGVVACISRSLLPSFFFRFGFYLLLHHFPLSSLPPCLDAIWKHCNFQEIPPHPTLVWKHISDMVVEALGHLEQRVIARRASVARQARSEGVGYVLSEGAVALEIVEAVNDAVVGGLGLGR